MAARGRLLAVTVALTVLLGGVPTVDEPAVPPDAWSGGLADAGNSSVNAGEHTLTAAHESRPPTSVIQHGQELGQRCRSR